MRAGEFGVPGRTKRGPDLSELSLSVLIRFASAALPGMSFGSELKIEFYTYKGKKN